MPIHVKSAYYYNLLLERHNLQNKYVHMVDLNELRKIIDSDNYLMTSNIISNIYKNKNIMKIHDIYSNIDLTIIDSYSQSKINWTY